MSKLAVVESNRLVGMRVARVVSSVQTQAAIHCVDFAELASVHPEPIDLVWCDESCIERALEGANAGWIHKIAVWTTGDPKALLQLALREIRIAHILGWPSFTSMPRPWELLLATRMLLSPEDPAPHVMDLVSYGASSLKLSPESSSDRDRAVEMVDSWLKQAQISPRAASRAAEVAHELLMNAMYDAPVDAFGQKRFAMDRRQDLSLAPSEAPVLRLASDGMLLALQVSDPFGRLERHQLLAGILRGLSSSEQASLDTRGGGAGLGLHRVYAAGIATVAEVRPAEYTKITCALDLDTNPRDLRGQPGSLHLLGGLARPSAGGWS